MEHKLGDPVYWIQPPDRDFCDECKFAVSDIILSVKGILITEGGTFYLTNLDEPTIFVSEKYEQFFTREEAEAYIEKHYKAFNDMNYDFDKDNIGLALGTSDGTIEIDCIKGKSYIWEGFIKP